MPAVRSLPLGMAVAMAVAMAGCGGGREPAVQPLPAADTRAALQRPGPPPAAVASYRIDAALDAARHTINASQTLTWRNTGKTPVRELPFHLYLNAFKNETSLFMRESRGSFRGAVVSKSNWGWIEIKTIRVGDGPDLAAKARFSGPDETVLEVPLERAVAPGATVQVAMTFEAQLPEALARTGFKGDFIMVGQWFPKVGVRVAESGREVWHCEPFHAMSEFFADFGNYDVSLTVPDTHVIAATGMLVKVRDNPDATRTLQYRAEAVHDFAWMADPFMETIAGKARTRTGDVEVRVYFRPEQRAFAGRHLAAGIGAIEQFSALLVPYPWARMSIIDPPPEAEDSAGGMEYPTLVTTGGDSLLFPEGVYYPEFVTIHEVGHNWFQGVLASNEVDEAWLDEGMNQYADGLVMGALYGEQTSAIDWGGELHATYYDLGRRYAELLGESPDPVAQRSYRFVDSASYGIVTYLNLASVMRTLEKVVGSRRFAAALRAYAEKHAFEHPREADLRAALERELGQDIDWFLQPALHQAGGADLRVRSIACRSKREPQGVFGRGAERKLVDSEPPGSAPQLCQVTVENLGPLAVPVDVEITTASGEVVRKRWDDRGQGPRWTRFELETREPVTQAVIDPDGLVPVDQGGVRGGLRVVPAREPAARAAAHGQFAVQAAMQVLGL